MMERLQDAVERIRLFEKENTVQEPFRGYFIECAAFVGHLAEFLRRFEGQDLLEMEDLEGLKAANAVLFGDLPVSYESSWLNPALAWERGGESGQLLSAFASELRGAAVLAYEKKEEGIARVLETLIQLYCLFETEPEEGLPEAKTVRSVLYSFCYDYSGDILEEEMREQYLPEQGASAPLLVRALRQLDFLEPEQLYRLGSYVPREALETAACLAALPQEEIDRMAGTWYRGFRDGFLQQHKPYDRKSAVELRYEMGFERVVRRAAEYFAEDGIAFTVPREYGRILTRTPGGSRKFYVSPNRQMDYDHAYDSAIFMGERITARMLEEREQIFRSFGGEIHRYAGPAVLESFGETPFEPVDRREALSFHEHQKQVYGRYQNDLQLLVHRYVLEEERSFTIIAWPSAGIGENFPEILRETIAVNTLPTEEYREIQQCLIDALDAGEYVEVTGRGNDTAMKVVLHPLENPERESNFENCLADVNIPLGEVFTSPVLTGTEGVLHVNRVFIGGYCFRDLRICFRDGRVTDYSCANFPEEESGKALIRKVIFGEKEQLPLGEFAIGTNTRAFRMAERFQLGSRLPILIAEKTGPHFAVGDTCYSFMEEMQLFNPDGKELTAKDNECSLLRKTQPEKAYFAVHTDITIPYNELGDIICVKKNGERIPLIREGRFVLPGTEKLNDALDEN